MKHRHNSSGFTLIELLVSVTITLVLAAIMLAVTGGTLDLWRRAQDNFTTSSQAKLVLDYLERDLQAAVFRQDGQTWLALDIINTPAALAASHGWLTATTMKPATAESQVYLPATLNGVAPTIANARFGLSGAWLRLIAAVGESGNELSLPRAIAYQVARRPVSGSVSAANPADVRYSLFRSAIGNQTTFANNYDVTAGAYGTTLANPSTNDVIATNVVDFGVWLYSRDSSGALALIYPATTGDTAHAASTLAAFPAVADVMVRILTEEGAKLVAGIESGGGAVTRPSSYASDAEWWWAVVETHSRVVVRRVEMKASAL